MILEPRNADMPTHNDTTFKLFKASINQKMLKDSKISVQNQKKMFIKARVVLTCVSQEQKWIRILDIDESIPKDDVFKLILAQNNDK
ncbi:hypothetical protein BLOT_016036, partial [Blomia tropicalis]